MLERVANTTPDGHMVESYSLVMKRSRSKQSRGGGRATAAGRDTAVFTRRLFGWADAIFVELIAWLALDVGFFEGRSVLAQPLQDAGRFPSGGSGGLRRPNRPQRTRWHNLHATARGGHTRDTPPH